MVSNKKETLASIIINNYNYGEFLADAINSAIDQIYSNLEIIVVDDGSTDNSRKVITNYGNKIIPVFKENGGQASAFNAGFAASRGEIIFFLDADDLFFASKVAEVVAGFQAHPDGGWCFHPQQLVYSDRNKLDINSLDSYLDTSKLDTPKEYDLRPYLKKGKLNKYLPSFGLPATSALCFQRSLLEQILPMPTAETIFLSDSYVKYLALALDKGFVLTRKLSVQRIHQNNAYTQRSDKRQVTARIAILTAYWLKYKCPSIRQFTNNIFATGLTDYWKTGGVEVQYQELVSKYMSTLNLLEKSAIYLKSFYYYLR